MEYQSKLQTIKPNKLLIYVGECLILYYACRPVFDLPEMADVLPLARDIPTTSTAGGNNILGGMLLSVMLIIYSVYIDVVMLNYRKQRL